MRRSPTAAVDLYWIPLGAGGHSVRFNGRVYEALEAARQHRARYDIYHVALIVELEGERYTIELAPSPDADEASRGVVATGAVGSRLIGWLRLFRYEVRCWSGGSVPDLAYAVGGPCRLTTDPQVARRLLDLVAIVPTPVWGRDELQTGEMWNSNSVIAWLLAAAGLPTDELRPPPRGRAPGWDSGLEVARRASRPLRQPLHRAVVDARVVVDCHGERADRPSGHMTALHQLPASVLGEQPLTKVTRSSSKRPGKQLTWPTASSITSRMG